MSRAFVLDTSAVLTAAERGNLEILSIVERHGGPSTGSMFVLGELRHGVEAATGKRTRSDRQQTVDFYAKITEMRGAVQPELLAKAYAQVSAKAATWGLRLGMNDRWIVAEAALHAAQLVTCDSIQADLSRRLGYETLFVGQAV